MWDMKKFFIAYNWKNFQNPFLLLYENGTYMYRAHYYSANNYIILYLYKPNICFDVAMTNTILYWLYWFI